MKKVVLAILLLIVLVPTYSMAMNDLLKSCDPSGNEEDRGWVGAALRVVLKSSGLLDQDMLGLGHSTERKRTEKIWTELDENPEDMHLQKQFCERQAKASQLALSLVAQLEKVGTNGTNSDAPQLSTTQETTQAIQLIELSIKLRALHARKSLAPEHTLRLVNATNQARQRIKARLGITDSKSDNQDPLLKEELHEETTPKILTEISPEEMFAYAMKLLTDNPGPNEKQLISHALSHAQESAVMAQARKIAAANNWELTVQEKTPPPPSDSDDD